MAQRTLPDPGLDLDLPPATATVTRIHPERWAPDQHLIDAALAGRLNYRYLTRPDRAWLIAQLTHRGIAGQLIADKLHCSLRTIKSIRNADPVAVLTLQLLSAQHEVQQRQAHTRPDTAAVVIANYVREIDQLKKSRGHLIDALAHTKARCTQAPAVVYLPHKYRRHPKPPAQPALFEGNE